MNCVTVEVEKGLNCNLYWANVSLNGVMLKPISNGVPYKQLKKVIKEDFGCTLPNLAEMKFERWPDCETSDTIEYYVSDETFNKIVNLPESKLGRPRSNFRKMCF